MRFLVLGAGFTGSRVVTLLRQAGELVIATRRAAAVGYEAFDAAAIEGSQRLLPWITPDTVVLYSIPTLHSGAGLFEPAVHLMRGLRDNPPAKVVYLSTTGVYGASPTVDEHTAPAPRTERERLRVAAEQAVSDGPWRTLILRPAAIYGPGRGIHARMRQGEFRLPPAPSNFVSRIHVDDLAALVFRGMRSNVEGAYPVADEEPCTSLEAAQFCASLLGVPLPAEAPFEDLGETRRSDRRVDGTRIRQLLGVSLRYPNYRSGFAACIEADLASATRERSRS